MLVFVSSIDRVRRANAARASAPLCAINLTRGGLARIDPFALARHQSWRACVRRGRQALGHEARAEAGGHRGHGRSSVQKRWCFRGRTPVASALADARALVGYATRKRASLMARRTPSRGPAGARAARRQVGALACGAADKRSGTRPELRQVGIEVTGARACRSAGVSGGEPRLPQPWRMPGRSLATPRASAPSLMARGATRACVRRG